MKQSDNHVDELGAILEAVFEEGRKYQQHKMQGENPKYIFTGAEYIRQIEDFYRNKIPEKEHYYSHKGKLQAGYADVHFCECGKYEQDRDRLLRHIHWNELKLTAQFNSKGVDDE